MVNCKTSALPSGDLFAVNEFACIAMAKTLAGYSPPRVTKPLSERMKPTQLALRLALASVCHQFNWDVLSAGLTQHLLSDAEGDIVRRLTEISAVEFQAWFDGSEQPERIRAQERARILRAVGNTLLSKFSGNPMNLLKMCKNTLKGASGFVNLMDSFDSFREDPLRKKTNVLTHEMVRDGIARFVDQENIAPAIDYHLIRLYLRSGRVYSLHPSIVESLADGDPQPRPRLVRTLREKVAEAVVLTARFSSLTVPDVNYIEWQLGRTTCVRETPGCQTGVRARPLDPAIAKLFEGMCPFSSNCTAFADPRWLRLQEPVFRKSYY